MQCNNHSNHLPNLAFCQESWKKFTEAVYPRGGVWI